MNTAPNVTVIPATITLQQGLNHSLMEHPLRVAGYARVSSKDPEQLTSYEAQVAYYTKLIMENPEWEFVKVYADKGITGTSTKSREEFNDMVDDALAGKIDMIITKSVSRFARNTLDSIATVRKLKAVGVDVYFENDNMHSMSEKGELYLTIKASLAQEESRNISENVTWGHRKRMADGKILMNFSSFLGYEKGLDGNPRIVEEEAAVIRLIYAYFLDGWTYRQIAKWLTDQGIPTPGGKQIWQASTVRSILQNEKYAGNAILQKRFTTDFLTKTTKINEGEVPMYFVENSHPAIIPPETFELVQSEIARRAELGQQIKSSGSPFTTRVICGDCGGFYGPRVWHSNETRRKTVWQCYKKYRDKLYCSTPHLSEDDLKAAFVKAFNQLLGDKERYIQAFEAVLAELIDTAALDEDIAAQKQECDVVAGLVQNCVTENARVALDQAEYAARYNALILRYETVKNQLASLEADRRERIVKAERTRIFLNELRRQPDLITGFDESAWNALAESMTVHAANGISVKFRDGTELQVAAD